MEQETGYVRNSAFSTRSLVTVFALVGVVTLGNLWLHSGGPPVGYARYTGFGFSIDYSRRMAMWESDLVGSGPPNDSGGVVQWARQDTELEQFGVFWIKPEGIASSFEKTPAGAIEQILGFSEMLGTNIGERGEMRTMTKDSHEVFYQTFTVEEPGVVIPGMMGAWYCEASGTYIILYAVHVPDINYPEILSQEVETIWLGYLAALACP